MSPYWPTLIRFGQSIAAVRRAKCCIRSSTPAISMEIASAGGLPVSREINNAISSRFDRIILRARIIIRPRSRNDRDAHDVCASRARLTARATASGLVSGARPFSSPVAGFVEMSSPVDCVGVACNMARLSPRPIAKQSKILKGCLSTSSGGAVWLIARVRLQYEFQIDPKTEEKSC